MNDCDRLAVVMRTNPQQFSNLKLFFSQSSQTTQRRETVIRVENVMTGNMASTLNQRFSNTPECLLTAEDEKRLLTESSTNVLIDSFDDSDVVSTTTEAQIYNMLKDMLVTSKATIDKESDQMWESVFWNDDNYRPDKTTSTMNEIYSKLEKDDRAYFSNEFAKAMKLGMEFSASVDFLGMISGSASAKFDLMLQSSGKTVQETVNKLMQEASESAKWEGEKFSPKPMSLSRVNLNNLRNTQELRDRNVRVSYSTAVLSVAVNFHPLSDKPSQNQLFSIQSQLDDQQKNIADLKNENAALRLADNALRSSINAISIPVAGPMPTSCSNYKTMGHTQSGFYLAKDSATKIKTIYCDFTKAPGAAGFESRLGIVDVKTSPVQFYVQRNSPYSTLYTTIPWQSARLNIGGAMNLTSGVFTAPRDGVYHFHFSGIGATSTYNNFFLRLNGANVGRALAASTYDVASLHSTLQLKSGDRVDLWLGGGILYEDTPHLSHFTGWLDEEDLQIPF